MAATPDLNVPLLTDAVDVSTAKPVAAAAEISSLLNYLTDTADADREMLIAELQTRLAAAAFQLTDDILRNAFAEMEASVFEQVSGRLRRELPEMIDSLLREQLASTGNQDQE